MTKKMPMKPEKGESKAYEKKEQSKMKKDHKHRDKDCPCK
jgi:hypothetical protein